MKVSLHLSLAFSLLTCMSTESFAKFSFRSWRGVEQYSKEDSHPVLGKIHSNLLSNLRLLDGTLYTFSKEHSQDKPKGDLIDFGQFLKTMFPSNAGVFAPSSEERSPIYHLSPYDIGCVVRLTKERKDINEIFEKNGKFYKRFHEAYYGRLMNDMKKNNNKNTQLLKRDFSPPSQEDIKKEIKDLENKISNKEEVRAQMMSMGNDVSAISQEIRKLKEKFSSIELSEKITNEHKEKFAEQHNQLIAMIKKNAKLAVEKSSQEFSEQVKKAIQCLQNQDHYPKNLVEMTFLALFWEKFSTKQDMQDFLSGLNGKDIKWEPQDIETENEILKILDSQDLQSLEKSYRALHYGNEILNPLAYPEDYHFLWNSNAIYATEEGKKIDEFSDCVEASLRQVLDLILHDNAFHTGHLKESSLKDFYENKRGDKGDTPATEWLSVVENLSIKECENDLYAQKKLLNGQEYRYEICPGILRMIHVLEHITSVGKSGVDYNQEKNLINGKDIKEIETLKEKCKEWLTLCFNAIAQKGRRIEVEIHNFNPSSHEKYGIDMKGDIEITVKQNGNPIARWTWKIQPNHAQIQELQIDEKIIENGKYKDSKNKFEAKLTFPILQKNPKDEFLKIMNQSLDDFSNYTKFMKNTSLKTDLEKGLFKTFMNRINWGDEGVTNYVMTKVLVHNKALETLLNLKDKKIMEQIASNVEEVNGIITGDKSLLFPMIKKCKVAPSGLRFLPHDVEEIATGLTSITELKNFQKLKSLEVFRLKGENNFEFPASCSTLTLLIQEGKHSMPQTSLPGIKDLIFSNKEFQGYVDNLESDIDVHGIIKCFPTAEKIIFECPHKNRIQILSYLFEDLKTLKSLTIKGKPNQMAEIKALKNLKAETINSDTIKITRE